MWFDWGLDWGLSDWPVESSGLLIAAALLDFVVGDPWSWPHPVQFIGRAIALYSKVALAKERPRWVGRSLGVGLAVLIIGGFGWLSALGLYLLSEFSPLLGWLAEVVLLASCFAGRSLRRAAEDVLEPLRKADLAIAREKLAMYVGRDTQALSAAEIRRALLETASENAVDGVFAPLFYAVLGAAIDPIAAGLAAPLAIAYKAASTLDSMVGYKAAPYTDLGWFSARLEDALTWVPCRISVLAIALLSGHPRKVLALCGRDGPADPSPNAGWSECAYAAALGVRLGGTNTYQGQVKVKPYLGDDEKPITDSAIALAYRLTRRVFVCLMGLSIASLWIVVLIKER